MQRFFARKAESRVRLELKLALAALKRAEKAAEKGKPAAAREALRVYARHVRNVREILRQLPQPPERILEKLSVYAAYEERVRERLTEINVSDERESFDEILTGLKIDEERRVELRKKIFEKYGVSPRVLLANELSFIHRVEARYLIAVQLNLSFNESAVRMHLTLARDEILAAKKLLNSSRNGQNGSREQFNRSAFVQHLRAAHTHAVQALRALKPLTPRKPVVIRTKDKLIIERNGTLRILPVPKPVAERIMREMREREKVRVFTREEVRERFREHARERLEHGEERWMEDRAKRLIERERRDRARKDMRERRDRPEREERRLTRSMIKRKVEEKVRDLRRSREDMLPSDDAQQTDMTDQSERDQTDQNESVRMVNVSASGSFS